MDAELLKCGESLNASKSELHVAKMPAKKSTPQEVHPEKPAPTANDMIKTGVIDDIKI